MKRHGYICNLFLDHPQLNLENSLKAVALYKKSKWELLDKLIRHPRATSLKALSSCVIGKGDFNMLERLHVSEKISNDFFMDGILRYLDMKDVTNETKLALLERYVSVTNDNGETLLHKIILRPDLAKLMGFIRPMLSMGFSLKAIDKKGQAPLAAMLENEHTILPYLNEQDDYYRLFLLILKVDSAPVNLSLSQLLSAQKLLLNYTGTDKSELIEKLFDGRNDLDQLLGEGYTLLHYAVASGDCVAVKAIMKNMKNGIDQEIKKSGKTALHIALESQASPEIVKELVNGGAEVNYPNRDHRTPLDLARESDSKEIREIFSRFDNTSTLS